MLHQNTSPPNEGLQRSSAVYCETVNFYRIASPTVKTQLTMVRIDTVVQLVEIGWTGIGMNVLESWIVPHTHARQPKIFNWKKPTTDCFTRTFEMRHRKTDEQLLALLRFNIIHLPQHMFACIRTHTRKPFMENSAVVSVCTWVQLTF